MKTVWKYHVPISDFATVAMPKKAQILHVAVQHDFDVPSFQLWALVDTEEDLSYKTFRIAGTGHEITGGQDLSYVGTVFFKALVFHVFKINN